MWRVKAVNFLTLILISAKVKYFPLFLDEKGMTPTQIGVLMGFGSFAQFLATPIWGVLSDVTNRPALMLGIGLFVWTGIFQAFRVESLSAYSIVFYALLTIFEAAMSLIDVISVAAATRSGESYGGQRWLASLGFGAGCLVSGALVEAYGYSAMFFWSLFFGALLTLNAYFLDKELARTSLSTPPDKYERQEKSDRCNSCLHYKSFSEPSQISSDEEQLRAPTKNCDQNFDSETGVRMLIQAAKAAIGNQKLVNILVNAILFGNLVCLVDVFMILHIQQSFHVTKTFVGFATLAGTLSEIPVFLYSGKILSRYGKGTAMLFSHASFALRLILLALVTFLFDGSEGGYHGPNGTAFACCIIATQALHGLCLGPYWAGAVENAFHLAPSNLKGAFLGLLSMSFYTLAFAIGSMAWGIIYEKYGGAATYTAGAVWTLISAFHMKSILSEPESRRKQ